MRPDVEVKTCAHSDELFPVGVVERGSATRNLPKTKTPLKNVDFETGWKRCDLFDYLGLNRVAELLTIFTGRCSLDASFSSSFSRGWFGPGRPGLFGNRLNGLRFDRLTRVSSIIGPQARILLSLGF